MYKKPKLSCVGAVLLGLGLAAPGWATGQCISVEGKIFNNAMGPGSTLGVAHVNFGKEKFKCALRGVGKNAGPDSIGPLNFDHTIVCDDNAGTFDLPVHSQLVLDTSGYPTSIPTDCPIPGLQSFSFIEVSKPVPGSGTGRFQDVVDGKIAIKGTLYCSLAIDMKFSGQLCF